MITAPAVALLVAAVLVCGQPAFAQDSSFHPVDSVLKALDLKTDVGPAPGFVEESRPKTDEFLSVGQQHPARDVKVKTRAELRAMEAELDAARERHDKLAGRKLVPEKPAKTSEVGPPILRATQN